MESSSPIITGLKLTAVPRPSAAERDVGNLFVRLTPQTAWHLASLLINHPSNSKIDADAGDRDYNNESVPEFLPLQIIISNQDCRVLHDVVGDGGSGDGVGNITIYASYNGGAPATVPVGYTNNHNIIEVPIDLHPFLQSIFNSTIDPLLVSVHPIADVPTAERVTFEPITVADWEMIEMEANMLEDGGLLNQITVVSPGQILPLRFGGNWGSLESAAWIKVVDIGCGDMTSNSEMNISHAYATSDDLEFDDSSTDSDVDDFITEEYTSGHYHPKCMRLMAETEVVVIPKSRIQNEEDLSYNEEDDSIAATSSNDAIFCPSMPLRVQPTFLDAQYTVSILNESQYSLPNPQLGFVTVHPLTLMQLPGYQLCNKITDIDANMPPMVATIRKVNSPYAKKELSDSGCNDVSVVLCIIHASKSTHKGHIGMHPLLRHQLGVRPMGDWIAIQLWTENYVTSSIKSVRDGKLKFILSKVVPSNITSSLYNSCDHCKKVYFDNMLSSSIKDATCSPDPVFTSGSIIPTDFLQSLGLLDWLDKDDSDMLFTLNIEHSPVDNYHNDTSQLVPVITVRDLKGILKSDMRRGTDSKEILEMSNYSFNQPLSTKYTTVGFTSAIQSIHKSAKQILSFTKKSMHNHAIMVVGDEGSGKSHLSLTASSHLCLSDLLSTVYLDCKKLQAASTNIRSILEAIQQSFQEAVEKQPSVLVLDDLDTLIPNVESSDANGDGSIQHHQLNPALAAQVKIIVDHLVLQSDYCCTTTTQNTWTGQSGVILLCTCRDKDSISTRYQRSGVFHSLIEVPSLDASQRAQFIYNSVFGNMPTACSDKIPHAIIRLGKDTDSFRPKDLQIVATRITHFDCLRSFHSESLDLKSDPSSFKSLESGILSILEDYSPLSQQLVDINHNFCSIDWESIGGLYKVKQSLYDSIIHPMKFKLVYENAPMSLPTGVLLYGPPGNGKSFVVPLLAKKSKLNLIICRGPELLDRYIGASEAKVRQLFARANAAAPCIIWFDEFDSLAPQRGSDHTGVTDRVVNQLLTLLDGAESNKKAGHIFIIAATSRPDKIDKALLRPGRLEKHIYVGYPESMEEWNSLFASLLMTRNIDKEVSNLLHAGDLFNSFCKDFEYAKDMSAADIKAVLDTAHLLCVHDILDTVNNDGGVSEHLHGSALLSKGHILEAFRRTRPSLLPKDRDQLQHIYAKFGSSSKKEKDESSDKVHTLKTSLR